MLPRRYFCADRVHISYINIWYDCNHVAAVISSPITESKQKYMCAGLCHVHSNPRLNKKRFKKVWLTGKQTNQRRSNGSNVLNNWHFIQSEIAKGAETDKWLPREFTSVNISSVLQPEDETSKSWNKSLALRSVFFWGFVKDIKSNLLYCY